MVTSLTLVLFVLLTTGVAQAEFTAAEKASVHDLALATNLIRSGLQEQVAKAMFPGYWAAWQAVVDCHDALGYLLGTQLKQGDFARKELAATPRAGWLALAWKSLDRCANGLASAQAQAIAVTNKYGQAQIMVRAFPRAGIAGPLPLYSDPKPASWPAVIGPHGDYDYSQENVWFAVKYLHDSLWLYPGSRYVPDAANYATIVMAALANVRFNANETADHFDSTKVDGLDNVLWLQKFALQDTSVKYLAATQNEYAIARDLDVLRAVVKHNDSWKNLDRAMRNTLCLPHRSDGQPGIPCDRTPH